MKCGSSSGMEWDWIIGSAQRDAGTIEPPITEKAPQNSNVSQGAGRMASKITEHFGQNRRMPAICDPNFT